MDIIKFNKTFTTKFILPLLFKQPSDYSEIFNECFINAYIGDIRHKEYDDKILMVFADYPSVSVTHKLLPSVAEYRDDDKYILVLDLPEEYISDYYNFLTGKYDHFNDCTKDKILKFWQCDNTSLLYNVLSNNTKHISKYLKERDYKHSLSKDACWFAPVLKNELLGVI
jgi:hypothetical protein